MGTKNQSIVDGCEFFNNTALKKGGAIYMDQTLFLINNSIFTNNSALIGGALFYQGTRPDFVLVKNNLTYKFNNFSNNVAPIFG